ncbi:MAG: hypothetical protein A3B74_00155 [Candidatus Kerfeldbacteria bacterium RIFCSPHIGHO2_02_FULL_42_14]|uniref:Uncharacterized protein n=1 Tax=Candidatus Kerfeldbacteria bacterium RIFCSPHIGHO2_02_FULL_42_14 TaxID=1798540 RepID=A0A1G2AQR9_9BACT|nr:MAG: hypothetical protein A3B74_00155 [Candidatus Kerfeldbacteria bacterium RIFCSPHIGHO2_02_FULL_42_14]OGY81311.1 MAG: hypothetical protein A3E60_02585 [Candidatus Kerfeldbacteria bacterium RIFCSPHIGHO2_12_FULL_42_13]OGY83585.1 MAG: hypothetical protein A3I91_03015 [Candidatus Kerfeldbacteria bacterium RIFCSPLOWO2_02_FULL_42_19]OGY86701.1 MAG: hypothetical protein A3G01_00610 [Candidatus Kerfeldbacteria bacterium RIFCSPLOWO2_12_FULL_43_9]
MHPKRWEKILEHIKSQYTVLEHHPPEPVEGTEAVLKESIVVQGQQGKTRFERFTRVPVKEDPLDTSHSADWIFSELAITSYVKGYRWNEKSGSWDEFNVKDIFFKT